MKRVLLVIVCQFGLLAGGRLFADVVTMNDGRQIAGLVESGNTQELHIKIGDRAETIDIHQVQAIQFGVSSAAPLAAPPKTADPAPLASEPSPAQPNSLILNDGRHIAGKWWSIDATNMHFLENGQLRHYPRSDVSAVTFGNVMLSPMPARSTSQPAKPAQPPVSAPAPERSSATTPPPTLARPSGSPPPSPHSRGLSQPDEMGVVYSWNGKGATPLERNRAIEHRSGSTQYWEMSGPQSPVRLNEASSLVFVVGLPNGVNPATYVLFALETVKGNRRTQLRPGRRGGPVTWPVDIVKKDDANIVTYIFTVRDLPVGEYSFSPTNSNDGFCFGVDPSAPGQ